MTPAARRRAALAAAGLLILGTAGAVLSGCGGVDRAVEVSPPEHARECESATRLWPETVANQSRRLVRDFGGPEADARAWGDPAIIATCGWPSPGPTTDECLDVDGVDWVVTRLSDGARFSTYGRDPAIVVLVPAAYAPEPLLLPAFGPAVKALPATGRHCT